MEHHESLIFNNRYRNDNSVTTYTTPFALFQVQLFINCLLASADYDSFFNVMKKEAQKSLQQKQRQAHAGGKGNDSENKQDSKPTAGAEGKDSREPRDRGEGKMAEGRRSWRDEERSQK